MFRLSKSKNIDFLYLFKKSKKIYDDVPFIKRKRRQRLAFKILKYFSIVILVFIILFLVLFALYFKDIKIFYNSALNGKKNIEKSVELIMVGKYTEGNQMANVASENFGQALSIADKYNSSFLFENVTYLHTQIKDLKYLMHSAEVISKAVSQAASFASTLEDILVKKDKNFNQLSEEDKRKLLETIYKSSPELIGIKANIELALLSLGNISYSGLLSPFHKKVGEIESKLLKVQENINFLIPLSNFLPVVLGYPDEANYLLILQNNDELRPTGGFIGTYGILQTYNGDIKKLDTHDVYHLDMPVKDVFSKEPPEPLKEYLGVDKWYFRDSNWSPDWPSSAQQIEWFFKAENEMLPDENKESGFDGDFDGVIAITPDFVTDILALVGEVTVEGTVFNSDNFVELLEYKVEQEYIQLGIRPWHRKEVIAEIVKQLKIKIFDLDPANMYNILGLINNSLLEKNILLYFNDPAFEEIAKEMGWTGEIKQYDSDFLMVVDANMASYKTDAVISRSMDYKLVEGTGSELISLLKLNYSHHGGFDWRTTRYRTYTRVYVPRGSQLIKITGAEENSTKVYDEYGKTVFAFFLKIEPGKMKNVEIDYSLPETIRERIANNNYVLYVQKQPGKDLDQLNIDLNFKKEINTYKPTGFFANLNSNGNITWESDLESDRSYIVKFK